jgi:hypothetical protein
MTPTTDDEMKSKAHQTTDDPVRCMMHGHHDQVHSPMKAKLGSIDRLCLPNF